MAPFARDNAKFDELDGIDATGVPSGQSFLEDFENDFQVQGDALDGRMTHTGGVFFSKQKRFETIPIDIGADIGSE